MAEVDDGVFQHVGQLFRTFDEFKQQLKNYEHQTKHVFTVCRSVSVEAGNQQLKKASAPRFKDDWQYKQATIACKQFGSRPSESTGVRTLQQ